MNKIRFDIQHSEFGNLVVPIIDGKSLISVLKEIELPLAKKEGSPTIAGAYNGLPIELVRQPIEYYSGMENSQLADGKIALLVCDCLCAGCWDFVAEIEAANNNIIWKNFEQIHRETWNYDDLGIITIDRKQFEAALEELENK